MAHLGGIHAPWGDVVALGDLVVAVAEVTGWAMPFTATVRPARKFWPLMVTVVALPLTTDPGARLVMTGGGLPTAVTLKPMARSPNVPSGLTTRTS